MEHSEIRFMILNKLYQKYYEEPGHPQQTDNIIKECNLSSLLNDTTGDILYLINKGLIDDNKSYVLGRVLPIGLTITPDGIDMVEAVLDEAIYKSKEQNSSEEIKKEIETISSIESPTQKYKKFLDFTKLHMDILMPIINMSFKGLVSV